MKGAKGKRASNIEDGSIIGSADLRHLGRVQDIAQLMKDRAIKNWMCWILFEEFNVDLRRNTQENSGAEGLVQKFRSDILITIVNSFVPDLN